MPTLFHLFFALCLTLTPVLASQARAAQSPGSILPTEGPIHDELVNRTMPRSAPYPEEGREGYVGTYTDPATGDSITTIVSPRAPRQEQQQGPIIVYPQVGTPYGGMVIEQQGHINRGYRGNGDARPPRGPSPNLPGNKVQHPGLGMPGGNPGNMDNYRARPGHAGRP